MAKLSLLPGELGGVRPRSACGGVHISVLLGSPSAVTKHDRFPNLVASVLRDRVVWRSNIFWAAKK